MSDTHRKDFTTKASETLTPDAMKSDTQKAKETTTDTADRAVREGQTDSSKSTVQKGLDKTEHAKDNTQHGSTGETVGDKVKHAVGMGKKDEAGTTSTTPKTN